ncbi:histone-lysine N-methyltransferase set-1-like [Menidia menidia]
MTLQNEQCRQICLFYLQIKMPPRITPLNDAIQHIISKRDKTFKLEVKYIDAVKGRGIFAKSSISKGEFVVEYKGDMINDAESQRRKKLYHSSCLAFMFAFKWKGKLWCIDASRDDGSFGRLINDEHRRPNCRMKKIDVNGNPHLCLFALNDIKEGEEITYDYGGEDCPWRTKVTIAMAQSQAVDESLPVPLPKIPTSDSSQSDCPEQVTIAMAQSQAVDESLPVPLPKIPTSDSSQSDCPEQVLHHFPFGVSL